MRLRHGGLVGRFRFGFGRFEGGFLGGFQEAVGELNDVALVDEPVQISNDDGLLGRGLIGIEWKARGRRLPGRGLLGRGRGCGEGNLEGSGRR